jgi:hypothetical protein
MPGEAAHLGWAFRTVLVLRRGPSARRPRTAPVRRFLPAPIDPIWTRQIDPARSLTSPRHLTRPPEVTSHGRTPRHQGTPAALTPARQVS